MPPAARAAADARALALRADALLSELRARSVTGLPDAPPLPPGEEAGATIAADDMPVAALRRLVRSFGGELEVALPDGRRVRLGGLTG